MSDTPDPQQRTDRRWPRSIYGVGQEPDPRFSFANERTFLAWIRTGLGFVAAGVAIAAIGDYAGNLAIETEVASILLLICGLAAGVGAVTRWMRNERALRLNQPLPSSPVIHFLTLGVIAVALIALLVVSFR